MSLLTVNLELDNHCMLKGGGDGEVHPGVVRAFNLLCH